MKVGFTGTKQGMTVVQEDSVGHLVDSFTDEWFGLDRIFGHHGDCIGADAQFHDILLRCWPDRSYIVIHPPKNDKYRAFCHHFNEIREPKDYGVRDKDIVKETDVLIATPRGFGEELRSGTWMTIRIARKLNKDIYIIWPDGKVEKEINKDVIKRVYS